MVDILIVAVPLVADLEVDHMVVDLTVDLVVVHMVVD
jgi:hypothetical protein